MEYGAILFPTDHSIGVVDLARAVEERGLESLFLPEHSHIPTSRRSPWPGGAELPEHYRRTLDPFVALGAAAAVTNTLQLGLGVCLLMQRDPIQVAKEVASLDHVSGGRVLFGVGGGWNREEMADHGTDPRTRWEVLRERVLACKEIWTQEEAEFHGRHVDFDPMWAWPKPVRVPPILVGGNGAGTFERVLEYGDGWMPLNRFAPGAFAERVQELQKLAADRGHDPVPVTLFNGRPGIPDAATLAGYDELGLHRVIFALPQDGRDSALAHLDELVSAVGLSG